MIHFEFYPFWRSSCFPLCLDMSLRRWADELVYKKSFGSKKKAVQGWTMMNVRPQTATPRLESGRVEMEYDNRSTTNETGDA